MDKSIVPVNQLSVRSSTCYEFSNPNEAVVVEIEDDDTSVETVERQIENLKLNYHVAPEDVLRVIEVEILFFVQISTNLLQHFFNSDGSKECILSSRNNKVDIDKIINVLQSHSDDSKIIEGPISFEKNFTYYYVKSGKRVGLFGNENCIGILNITD
ncbi:hypothetical protein CAEBREN_04201 [Caenorhabditis brenneri]|uniref:DUF38 domain-containing protein n=1 Tax=Caenorhabditis brenneri TaxID=135651 RepID=G0P287_CAEBE|nr:hypothetical protein CAEBREN_04201 [Caenorhabditis brenneri]